MTTRPAKMTMSLRVDPEVKKEAEELFGSLGISVPIAINMFLAASIRHGGLPFDIALCTDSSKTSCEAQHDLM